jgi:hypothetical protein
MDDLLELIEVLPTVLPVVTVEPLETNQDAPDLEFLVSQINQLQIVIKSNELISKTNGQRALGLAIKSGKLLLECKNELLCKSKRGNWMEWVGKNITSIKYQTVTRYIELFQNQSELDECESIREAYYKLGIYKRKTDTVLPPQTPKVKTPKVEPEPEEPDTEETILEIPFDIVKRLVAQISETFKNNQGDGENYTDMVNLLEPVVMIYNDHQDRKQVVS